MLKVGSIANLPNVVRHSKTEPNKMKVREEKLRTIIEWSEKNEDVRVLLLTSSLVNPLALVDEFSDLDIEFVLRIIQITFQTKAGRLNSEIQLL